MKLCNEKCFPCCDFCLNFREINIDKGFCKITGEVKDRGSMCEDNFECFRTGPIYKYVCKKCGEEKETFNPKATICSDCLLKEKNES